MKLTTRGRYGVRLMLELALQYGKGPIYMKDIAKEQGISEKYLWKLLKPLNEKGLVHSTRGVKGGFTLAKAPQEISLKDIVHCLEGSLCLVDCVDTPSLCDRSPACIFRDFWREVSMGMNRTLEKTTLATMLKKQKGKAHAQGAQ